MKHLKSIRHTRDDKGQIRELPNEADTDVIDLRDVVISLPADEAGYRDRKHGLADETPGVRKLETNA